MNITMTLDDAARLFDEARELYSERAPYIHPDSEIRKRAVETFGRVSHAHVMSICHDVFYVLACAHMKVPR